MKRVDLYTRSFCVWCLRAKFLLFRKGVSYVEHDASGDDARASLLAQTGQKTVPQVFIDDEFISGFDELAALDSTGQLDRLLRASRAAT